MIKFTGTHPLIKLERFITEEECNIICDLISKFDIKLVVEIGTAHGYSAACMASTGVKVITFDIAQRLKVWDLDKNITSKNISCHVGDIWQTSVDLNGERRLFFIDGDHTITGATKDLVNVYKIMKPNDIMVVHDILGEKKVGKVWTRLKKPEYQYTVFKTKNGLGLIHG